MQCVIAQPEGCVGALAAPSGPKGVRELSQREHTSTGVALDRFLAEATQKAQIVFADRPVAAAVAELADVAMFIQQ